MLDGGLSVYGLINVAAHLNVVFGILSIHDQDRDAVVALAIAVLLGERQRVDKQVGAICIEPGDLRLWLAVSQQGRDRREIGCFGQGAHVLVQFRAIHD